MFKSEIIILLLIFTFSLHNQCNSVLIRPKTFEYRISYIHKLIRLQNWNCTDVVNYFFERTTKYNTRLGAIITLNPRALDQAVVLDNLYKQTGAFKGKLHCVPFVIKDNIDVLGMPTTGGIKALRNSFPSKDALVISRLLAEGAIVISKANLGELAWGIDQSEMGGQCKNPYDARRSCGPSSIGSGAAIGSSLGIVALGTDTDGSIMIPGSYNSIFALRTPQNIPSIDGIIPAFTRQDTVGPFSKYIDDTVLTYSVITGNSTLYDEYSKPIVNSNLKVGYWTNFVNNFTLSDPNNPSISLSYYFDVPVKVETDKAIQKFRNLNMSVYEYNMNQMELGQILMTFKQVVDNSHICMQACKKSSLNSYFGDAARFEEDAPVKTFETLFKSGLLSQFWRDDFSKSNVTNPIEYCANQCVNYDSFRATFKTLIDQWFDKNNVDVIILPTRVQLPYIVNQPQPNSLPTFTSAACISGYPALNVPVGYSSPDANAPDGLPIGIVMFSKPERITNLFKIAKSFENNYGVVKMPSSTPVIWDSSSSANYLKMQYLYLIGCIYLVYFNINLF